MSISQERLRRNAALPPTDISCLSSQAHSPSTKRKLSQFKSAIFLEIRSLGHESCSGLMKPDTHLGENARHIEVSDDQATSCLFR